MKSFHPGLFGGLGVAPTVLALSAMVGVDCSNSPPAGSAEGDASASDATVPPEDSSSPAKNEAGTDAAADGTVPEASVDAAPDAPIDAGQDSAGPPMQSCAPGGAGLTNCGSDAGESCCTSLEVSGGAYYRTYDGNAVLLADGGVELAADGGATGLGDPANVSGFRLDKYLVTVGRFRQFVSAWNGGAGWLPAAGSGKHTHLNGGLGLAAAPNVDAGQTYEPGWVASDDSNIAPTNGNLACEPPYYTWTDTAGSQENLPINCVVW